MRIGRNTGGKVKKRGPEGNLCFRAGLSVKTNPTHTKKHEPSSPPAGLIFGCVRVRVIRGKACDRGMVGEWCGVARDGVGGRRANTDTGARRVGVSAATHAREGGVRPTHKQPRKAPHHTRRPPAGAKMCMRIDRAKHRPFKNKRIRSAHIHAQARAHTRMHA